MNILFLTTILPGGKCSGGEIVSQQIIDTLRRRSHQVSVLGYKPSHSGYQERLGEIAIGERYIETKTAKYYPLIWMISSYLRGLPYSAAKYYSTAYLKKTTEILATERFDVVIIDHAQLGWLLDIPAISKHKSIAIGHNVEHQLYREQMQKTTNPIAKKIYQRESRSIELIEERIAATVDLVLTLTASDAGYFSSIASCKRVSSLNLPITERLILPDRASTTCDLGLLGTWTWQPNQDGLSWFFDRVYPYLPKTLSIRVAGKGADWLQGRYPNVEYCGFVPDAQAFIAQAKAISIPVLGGGGIQIKTLEAISTGAAIVATPTAMRGINNYPASVKVASDPQEFAALAIESIAQPLADWQIQAASDWVQQRWQDFDRDVGAAIGEPGN